MIVKIKWDKVCKVIIGVVDKKKLKFVFRLIVIVIIGEINMVIKIGMWFVNVKLVGLMVIFGIIIGMIIFIVIKSVEIVKCFIEFVFIKIVF